MSNTFIFDDEEPTNSEDPENELGETPEEEEQEGGTNRTFLFAAIGLGSLILITLICLGAYALWWVPRQNALQANQEATLVAINTETALTVDMTKTAMEFTATLAPTDVPPPTETPTPLMVEATETLAPDVTVEAATATVQALQTQLALQQEQTAQASAATGTATAGVIAKATTTPTVSSGTATALAAKAAGTNWPGPNVTVTALSNTGFADEVGLPVLFVLSIFLVAVILVARRLRSAPVR